MKEREGKVFRIGEIGQWLGMAASIAGIAIELIEKADYGWLVLTLGSVLWAVSTKVKYYRGKKREHHGAGHRMRH